MNETNQAKLLEKAVETIRFYADESRWYTPKFCNDYLHGHPGHTCTNDKWAFNFNGDGSEKAQRFLQEIERGDKDGE